jgi:hypothetical protein
MPDHLRKRPRDPVQLGKLIGDILTGQVEDRAPTPEEEGKDHSAVDLAIGLLAMPTRQLGRVGSAAGGIVRAAKAAADSERGSRARKAQNDS